MPDSGVASAVSVWPPAAARVVGMAGVLARNNCFASGSAAHDRTMTARQKQCRAGASGAGVFAAAEVAVLGVVGGVVAHRLDGADLGVGALDGVAGGDLVDPGFDVRTLGDVDAEQIDIAQPRVGGDVGDAVFVAGDIGVAGEPVFIQVEQPVHFGAVAGV